MGNTQHIVIIGGHGKIALMAAAKLAAAGHRVTSLIRNPDHETEVANTGATATIIDIEHASVDQLTDTFRGADAVVFSAGAGGGNPARTHAIDYLGAKNTVQAAEKAEVRRFIMVSYSRSRTAHQTLDQNDSFYPYAKAKHDADEVLRASELNYTILGPGLLTLEPASGKILIADENGDGIGRELAAEERVTSRENVAEVILHVLTQNAAVRQTVNFYDGDTPIADAIR